VYQSLYLFKRKHATAGVTCAILFVVSEQPITLPAPVRVLCTVQCFCSILSAVSRTMLCTDHGPTVVYTTTKRCTTLFYCTVINPPKIINRNHYFLCTVSRYIYVLEHLCRGSCLIYWSSEPNCHTFQ